MGEWKPDLPSFKPVCLTYRIKSWRWAGRWEAWRGGWIRLRAGSSSWWRRRSNGSLPMDQIGEAIGIQREPIASPFTKPVQFAANPKVSAALVAAATMNTTAITGAVADLGAHLVLQQIFYGNMFTDTPLLDG